MKTALALILLVIIGMAMAGCSEYKSPIITPTPIIVVPENKTLCCPPVIVEKSILSKDIVRTVVNESTMDKFNLPGNGTYRFEVRTYQADTELTVSIEWQELISTDKFGTKTYGGFGVWNGYCEYHSVIGGFNITCYPDTLVQGAFSTYDIGAVDRWHDLNTTITLPRITDKDYYYTYVVEPRDFINLHLVITTTKANQGRITIDVFKED
jgi:hypothetical protein